MKCIVSDLDGTLFDVRHRLHYIADKVGNKKDWGAFYRAMRDDPVIKPMRDLLIVLNTEYDVHFSTGRPEEYRDLTEKALRDIDLRYGWRVHMRKDKDYRRSDIIKLEHLIQMREDGLEPIVAFEDEPRCIEMYRANGVFTFALPESGG